MRAPPESLRPMTGAPTRGRLIHDLDDLGGVGLRQRAAEDGEVLGEDKDQAAFDASVAGDKPVAENDLLAHAEVGGAMGDKLVGLLEAALIEQKLDAFAGGHFAEFVFARTPFFAAASFGQLVAQFQLRKFLLDIHEPAL